MHVNVSGGGVTTGLEHPELAQQFLEWLATDGQNVLVDANHEYPANPDVAPEPLISRARSGPTSCAIHSTQPRSARSTPMRSA